MTLNKIAKWQQSARPANEDDISSALGIFLEAVAEVLDEFTQLSVKHDGVTALADMLHDLAMFSHELKTWQIEVSVPDYALKNLIKKTSDVAVTSISLVHVLRSLNFKHFVDRMPLHNDKVIKRPVGWPSASR